MRTSAVARGILVSLIAVLAPVLPRFGIGALADDVLRIEVLSNRADLISGGDALIEIDIPANTDPDGLGARIGGRDVTAAFADRGGGRIVGLIDGLELGDNRFVATLPDGRGAEITVTNHPIGGPVFSGPQVQPWFCDVELYGLEPPVDDQCNTNTRYDLHYMSAVTGDFAPYDPADSPPDVATTTTDDGVTVPYVVRVEYGVMNRGGYGIAVLFDPDEPWEPWAPQVGWNGKVFHPFFGDCSTRHRQGPLEDGVLLGGVLVDQALSRGYAVMQSSLNIGRNNCSQLVSAESTMMLKEHFIETYGPIRFISGMGCSGGASQQYFMSSSYPGLLDGLIPQCSWPDLWTSPVQSVEDCHLLQRVFDRVSPHLWANPLQQTFATGYPTVTACRIHDEATGVVSPVEVFFDPDRGEGCLTGFTGLAGFELEQLGLEQPDWVYHPETNPTGVRCTGADYEVAIWGRRPPERWSDVERKIGRGFANRAYDNVGVQYGLEALRAGQILPEQFVDLNFNVGGDDIDWNHQAGRSVADPQALEIAYRSGSVADFVAAASVAIIDVRPLGYAEFHPDVNSYVTRARLDAAHGHHENHVIWKEVEPLTTGRASWIAFDVLDRWLTAIAADDRDIPLADKVAASKPADAVDKCFAGGQVIGEQDTCETLFPPFASPRIAAGSPLTHDLIKCQLEPLDRSDDYGPIPFSDEQWTRLEEAFPDGVCDWSKPGVGQQPSVPWLTYADGPGGRPLGNPPISVPFGP